MQLSLRNWCYIHMLCLSRDPRLQQKAVMHLRAGQIPSLGKSRYNEASFRAFTKVRSRPSKHLSSCNTPSRRTDARMSINFLPKHEWKTLSWHYETGIIASFSPPTGSFSTGMTIEWLCRMWQLYLVRLSSGLRWSRRTSLCTWSSRIRS